MYWAVRTVHVKEQLSRKARGVQLVHKLTAGICLAVFMRRIYLLPISLPTEGSYFVILKMQFFYIIMPHTEVYGTKDAELQPPSTWYVAALSQMSLPSVLVLGLSYGWRHLS